MATLDAFPRTVVGGVSLPRMLIGTNWFMGYSHTSLAKDNFIKEYQTREKIAAILCVFLEYGIDAIMGGNNRCRKTPSRSLEDSSGETGYPHIYTQFQY